MHTDFCFVDRAGRGVIAGWSPSPDPALSLMVGGERVPITAITRFSRRDLGTSQDQGLIAAFRLRDASLYDGDQAELALVSDGELKELSADRLTQDEERLVASGVDEVFAAYLRFVAGGFCGRPRRATTRTIMSRIQGILRALPAETPGIALNLDRLLVSPSGLGVFAGWCMTDRAHPQALSALISGGRTLNPGRIILNSIRRDDLAVYRDRYRYTGTNGFCGAFRLPMTADRDARMVLLSNVPGANFFFGREAELVSDEEAAVALCDLRSSLTDPRAAEALTAAAAPRRPLEPFEKPLTAPVGLEAPVNVAVEVDVAPVELRDMLRLLHATLNRGYTVHLLNRTGGELSQPVAAAVAESLGEITLGEPLTSAQLLAHDFGPSWVIYGMASAFFQMPLPDLDPACARVAYHDPVGALGSRARPPVWPGDLNPPFLLATPAPLLAAGLRAVPRGFVTPDGIMRAVVDLLAERGLLTAERSGEPSWFPGTDMQSHPEYGIARALDTEMRFLVGHEERT